MVFLPSVVYLGLCFFYLLKAVVVLVKAVDILRICGVVLGLGTLVRRKPHLVLHLVGHISLVFSTVVGKLFFVCLLLLIKITLDVIESCCIRFEFFYLSLRFFYQRLVICYLLFLVCYLSFKSLSFDVAYSLLKTCFIVFYACL